MRIKGIGIISKDKAMEILTREGRKAVRDGEITTEELTPEQLGALTEAFYKCYGAGKNDKRGD